MLLIIDNYDSFVFNIARYCEELGFASRVMRNDALDLADIEALAPQALLISPGPCTPREAGLSLPAIQRFYGRIPILGICLGHQCIGAAFGGAVTHARVPLHGRIMPVRHNGIGLFTGLADPLKVGCYHSLIVAPRAEMTEHLQVDATSPEGEIMGLSHRHAPVFGVQFHPESVLSEQGHRLFGNFLAITRTWRGGTAG